MYFLRLKLEDIVLSSSNFNFLASLGQCGFPLSPKFLVKGPTEVDRYSGNETRKFWIIVIFAFLLKFFLIHKYFILLFALLLVQASKTGAFACFYMIIGKKPSVVEAVRSAKRKISGVEFTGIF